MVDIVVLIATTPVPTILAIGGLLLLLLGISDTPVAGMSIPSERKRLGITLGGLFLVFGIAFYALPLIFNGGPTVQIDASDTVEIEESMDSQNGVVNESATIPESQSLLEEAQNWPLIYQDNFETDRGIWQVGHIARNRYNLDLAIQDGQYQWSIDILDEDLPDVWGSYMSVAEIGLPNKVYLAADIQLTSGDWQGTRYGIAFRRQQNNLYSFRVEDGNKFAVLLFFDLEWHDLVNKVRIPNFEPGDVIRMALITDQSTYSFFINDNFLGQVEDDRLTLGNIGLAAYSESDISVVFDNVELRSPE